MNTTKNAIAAKCLIEAANLLMESAGRNGMELRYDSILADKYGDEELRASVARRLKNKKDPNKGRDDAERSRQLIEDNIIHPSNKKLHDKINSKNESVSRLLSEAAYLLSE